MYKASFVSLWNSDQYATSVRSNTSDICDKKSHIEPKYMKIMIELRNIGKLRLWSIILCNMTLKMESVW